jgi:hypothetical protein
MDYNVSTWCVFYLKCNKGKKKVHIKFIYNFINPMYYFFISSIRFMCHPLSVLIFGIGNTFCYKMIVPTTG